MKFRIESRCYDSCKDELLERYPCLKDFGFEIEEKTREVTVRTRDENGNMVKQTKFLTNHIAYIHISSLEELVALNAAVKKPLTFNTVDDCDHDNSIEIYDGYRE